MAKESLIHFEANSVNRSWDARNESKFQGSQWRDRRSFWGCGLGNWIVLVAQREKYMWQEAKDQVQQGIQSWEIIREVVLVLRTRMKSIDKEIISISGFYEYVF